MNLQIENKQVFFTDTGEIFDQKKHSIILLHGSGQSHVVWSLTAQYLSDQNYNVFALDFPGHGNSEGDSLKTIEEMAEWLEKVIIKIGKEAFYKQINMTLSEAYDYASNVMVKNMLKLDAEEGIDAFINKRTPNWQDK